MKEQKVKDINPWKPWQLSTEGKVRHYWCGGGRWSSVTVVVEDLTRNSFSENVQNPFLPTSVKRMGANSAPAVRAFGIPLRRRCSGQCLQIEHLSIFSWDDSTSVCDWKQCRSLTQSISHGIKFSRRCKDFLITEGKVKSWHEGLERRNILTCIIR